jgi:hypothetical protein
MLRLLLKLIGLLCLAFVLLIALMNGIGKTAPKISTVTFFSQEINGTDYWRLDLFTGVAFKDHYSNRILVSSVDSVAFNPVTRFLQLEALGEEFAIYEINLRTQEHRYIASYPARNHYIVLEGDFVFTVDFVGGSYDWTKIDIPSRVAEPFLVDTSLENLMLSPDEHWLSGSRLRDHLFINMLDGSQYAISGYCCIIWSPDSQWYIAAHENTAGIISVLSAEGQPHPLLPESFLAPDPHWANDSQAIFFQQQNHLASISLQTGVISEYVPTVPSFLTQCIAPNEAYILVYNDTELALIDIETGAERWQDENSSGWPVCFWSEDSRYLLLHISQRQSLVNGQRFVFIDTLSGNSWELYPEALPINPIYVHIPE